MTTETTADTTASPEERARAVVTALLAPASAVATRTAAFELCHNDPHPEALALALGNYVARFIRIQAHQRGSTPSALWVAAIAAGSTGAHRHDRALDDDA